MTVLKEKKALNKANQEIEQLKKENAEQRKKIPTIAQKIEQRQKIMDLQVENEELRKDNDRLWKDYNGLIDAINQLPKEIRKIVKEIILPRDFPEENEQSRGYDSYEI